MRRLSFILCIITFSLFLSACRTTNTSLANELTASSWRVENPNSVSASLMFLPDDNKAQLKIIDEKGESHTVDGVFAIDSLNLYITSETLCKTYTFGYTVYKDRLVLTYNGCDLVFEADKENEP